MRYKFLLTNILVGCILSSSCARSCKELWEDTKTCSYHMGEGFKNLFGLARADKFSSQFEFTSFLSNNDFKPSITTDYEIKEEPASSLKSPEGRLTNILQNINFETDSYSIKGEANIRRLLSIADYLKKHPHQHLFIEGHTDQRGTASYNLALGSRRANSVKTFLIEHGVSMNQLSTISYGKERPLTQEQNVVAWSKNRRSEFKINAK